MYYVAPDNGQDKSSSNCTKHCPFKWQLHGGPDQSALSLFPAEIPIRVEVVGLFTSGCSRSVCHVQYDAIVLPPE